jgi:hypothetical protein
MGAIACQQQFGRDYNFSAFMLPDECNMRRNCIEWVTLFSLIAIAVGVDCFAQEVAFIDLTKVTAHRELRRPTPSKNTSELRGGVEHTYGCGDSRKNAITLRSALVSLDRTHYQIGDEPVFEVTVENTGSTSLRIPFSPQLTDVQPKDPAQKFAYSELRLQLWIAADIWWSANTGGGVTLYGADDHPDTMITLNPGEWARIIGKGKFALPTDRVQLLPSGRSIDHAYAQAELYRSETLLTARATGTVKHELCALQENQASIPMTLDSPNE